MNARNPREETDSPEVDLPRAAGTVAGERPELWAAFQELGRQAAAAGPLDPRTRRLVNLGLALGGDAEGATHSHARRALAEGLQPDELEHVAFLAISTLGWPRAIRGLSWIRDITRRG